MSCQWSSQHNFVLLLLIRHRPNPRIYWFVILIKPTLPFYIILLHVDANKKTHTLRKNRWCCPAYPNPLSTDQHLHTRQIRTCTHMHTIGIAVPGNFFPVRGTWLPISRANNRCGIVIQWCVIQRWSSLNRRRAYANSHMIMSLNDAYYLVLWPLSKIEQLAVAATFSAVSLWYLTPL